MRIQRALLAVKKTTYSLLEKADTPEARRLRQMVANDNPTVAGVEASHKEHVDSLREVRRILKRRGVVVSERSRLPTKPIEDVDLIVVVGGDGMVLGVSHSVWDETPVIAVNSAPSFSVGYLTSCVSQDFDALLDEVEAERVRPRPVHRLRVQVGSRLLPEPVLNDALFCTNNPAIICRYQLGWPDGREMQRSSGVWVSTPAGSTSALSSAGGPQLPLYARQFAFLVREPYAPPGHSVRFRSAVLDHTDALEIESRTGGISVFLDGSHRRYPVEFGETVRFTLDDRPLHLIRPPQ
ncbi:MAG: NAD(+)/NADH kinase [Myxococcota bacterium]